MRSRARRLVAAAAACLALASCADLPKGFLIPTQVTAPGASLVDMLVVTTRRPSPKPGVIFSGERDTGHSVAEIVVSVPPAANRRPGSVQWPGRAPPDPARQFTTVSVNPSGPENTRGWFERVAGPSGRLLVFVHGYNVRFETAVYTFAQISHDSGADAAPLLFTWPSRGRLFDYGYDHESANFSRDALERILFEATQSPGVRDVTVLAHSMGTYLAIEALRQSAIRNGGLSPKIRNVILASPDLDPVVFERQYETLGLKRPHLTIFVTRDDRALGVSRIISGNLRRLGAIDPSKEPYRSFLEAHGDVSVIDLSAYKDGDPLNHGKFAASPEVVQLIGQRLVNGQRLGPN